MPFSADPQSCPESLSCRDPNPISHLDSRLMTPLTTLLRRAGCPVLAERRPTWTAHRPPTFKQCVIRRWVCDRNPDHNAGGLPMVGLLSAQFPVLTVSYPFGPFTGCYLRCPNTALHEPGRLTDLRGHATIPNVPGSIYISIPRNHLDPGHSTHST
ncbi:hypothetical protein BDZ97DRAFT_1865393 [Flammula alnicola]|nr:hypothetical protein BDZ97DRAFT_1865393 [Flammula alnicola]